MVISRNTSRGVSPKEDPAGKSGAKLKPYIYFSTLVKRRAVWSFKDFYTGS